MAKFLKVPARTSWTPRKNSGTPEYLQRLKRCCWPENQLDGTGRRWHSRLCLLLAWRRYVAQSQTLKSAPQTRILPEKHSSNHGQPGVESGLEMEQSVECAFGLARRADYFIGW